jgi:L-alanine-DL-glutamate epimerase-like enolase superfamily enzyme
MAQPTVVRIERALLEGKRPRHAGSNARLDDHGLKVRVPLVRLTLDDGSSGFGVSRAGQDVAQALIGKTLAELFDPAHGATPLGQSFDFPLWDLVAKRAGRPVYALAAEVAGQPAPNELRAPCYDTSLYIDDLHLDRDEAAADLIALEAYQGVARGHRAFKIKVGRGARHLPLEEGTRRDIAVIQAVRRMVGPQATVMIDVNNGYNLNLAKQVLVATADCHLHWLEEPFHEDRVLYSDLKAWLRARSVNVLIADGEGEASPSLLTWAQEGLIDVVQYDISGYGFTAWLALGQKLDEWGVRTAPHHYGGHYGNYAACHLAAGIRQFAFVEWDEATTPGLDTSAYTIVEGAVVVPRLPGFGLGLDQTVFQAAIAKSGYVCAR